ncbi:glycoside hydrolase family 27 protein [Crateriforma spongiae]|uniref:glycoside hydrolase family 27 protein n=1 Tax=Crateriforma spongiae TaxID=2724528 RepID=UPI001980A73E|nr:glycoside hydrolase family 27 protein [Crateriforma spongiae]
MNRRLQNASLLLSILVLMGSVVSFAQDPVAQRPPMGWNSFDAYDSTINEQQFRDTVDFMAEHLKPYGWQYAVVDYIWFNPHPGDHNNPQRRFGQSDLRLDPDGRPVDRLTLDEFGRPQPAVNRFPSSATGAGFKPLADYVHSKGLKFGIHIMRGIPRQAYFDDLPIQGSDQTAGVIAEPWDVCPWNNNMFGVDATKPGAQAYYDSLFRQYAQWGVDFVKADDVIHYPYHAAEIEMMRTAIDRCGRPMVLSLSPGDAPLSQAKHLVANANMWRVSGDLWDEWPSIKRNFQLLDAWSPFIGPGHWPDADMLPIGHLSLGGRPHGPDRMSMLTDDEQVTMMNLWCIAKSPLMIGADLLTSPSETMALLQNRAVLAVNQTSQQNQQVYRSDDAACWTAMDAKSKDRFVALFNLSDQIRDVAVRFEDIGLRGRFKATDLWTGGKQQNVTGQINRRLRPHASAMLRLTPESDVVVQPVLLPPPAGPVAGPNTSVSDSLNRRIKTRSYPSVFQAWNPIDMPSEFPTDTLEGRLIAAAKHDVIWEEPVSQLGYGVQLALGAIWDGQHAGLAKGFTTQSRKRALENRAVMLQKNPDMVFLMEVRWRDAPGSYLPEDSSFWKRNPDGTREAGWDGGPEPYYMLDYQNRQFQANIARQCKACIESGVYDGIMLDWSGQIDIVRLVREAIGDDGVIIVNIHDDIEDGRRYGKLINGSFMECNPAGPGTGGARFKTTWAKLREGLEFFERELRSPQLNCLEVWGDRDDLRRMRATTTLGLTLSNGSVLFADPNPLKTPDHLHDWYDFWDVPLGRPRGVGQEKPDGSVWRQFEGGVVVYNPWENGSVDVQFDSPHRRVSDQSVATAFQLADADGEIFVPVESEVK